MLILLESLPQYFGTLGSTLSLQARIPPFMLRTFLNPACFRKSTALALRIPLLQCATISSAESSSFTRFGRSPARRSETDRTDYQSLTIETQMVAGCFRGSLRPEPGARWRDRARGKQRDDSNPQDRCGHARRKDSRSDRKSLAVMPQTQSAARLLLTSASVHVWPYTWQIPCPGCNPLSEGCASQHGKRDSAKSP